MTWFQMRLLRVLCTQSCTVAYAFGTCHSELKGHCQSTRPLLACWQTQPHTFPIMNNKASEIYIPVLLVQADSLIMKVVGDALQGWWGYIACLLCRGWHSLQQAKNKGIDDCISKLSLASVAYKIDQLWAISSSSAVQTYCYTVDVKKLSAQTSSSDLSNNNSDVKEHVWSCRGERIPKCGLTLS